ncbi:o-succinylbenzoate--CoA ligase [Rhodococcus sp. 14-2483-1-2]|nr:o-succinylbenzoate--CoA ligase [Rhodococcus sp. 14-2483-1-2]
MRRWEQSVGAHPENTFLLFQEDDGTQGQWTYAEFDTIVDRFANRLYANGVRHGGVVHVCLRNSPAFVAIWLAASKLGAWFVPVDPASTERDISRQLERTHPTVGICARSRNAVYLSAASKFDIMVIEVEENIAGVANGNALLDGARVAYFDSHVMPSDRLAVMFTSGTTSEPKGVVLTQHNYSHVAGAMAAAASLRSEHRWLIVLPLFHANAQFYGFASAIAVGASVALTSKFSASRWLEQARVLDATHASLFAAPMRMILARTPEGAVAHRLELVWFAQSLGEDHYSRFTDLVQCRPRQLYGMTETVAVVTADDNALPTHDVIGRPVHGRAVRLVDPVTDADVGDGEVGMIVVAGSRGEDLFSEYLDEPSVTAGSFFADGDRTWFRTGDLAVKTELGALRFVGRIDDVIKVAGENVSLTEVEAAVAQAPGVLEAAVVSMEDPIRDHVPVAYVVPNDPANPPNITALASWAERALSPKERPRDWHIIDELPRTSVGKIRRFKIRSE